MVQTKVASTTKTTVCHENGVCVSVCPNVLQCVSARSVQECECVVVIKKIVRTSYSLMTKGSERVYKTH